MDELLKVFNEAPFKVLSTLLTAALLAALAFLSKTVRRAVFYKRHDFELKYSSASSGCEWDIQWENLRVTLQVASVHNDYLEGLTVKTNDVSPGTNFPNLKVAEAYVEIEGRPRWLLKLASIVRAKANGTRDYVIHINVLRPRW